MEVIMSKNTFWLEQARIAAQTFVSRREWSCFALQNSVQVAAYFHHELDNLCIPLDAFLWEERCPPIEITYPKNWWEAVKDRFLPPRLKKNDGRLFTLPIRLYFHLCTLTISRRYLMKNTFCERSTGVDEEAINRLKKGVNRKSGPWARQSCRYIRGAGPPKRNKTPVKDTEAEVQRECVRYLRSLGIPVNRQNAGKIRVGIGFIQLALPGAADLVGIMPDGSGRHLEVECKRRDGKGIQSDTQKQYQELVEKWGGVYLLVTSAEDLKNQLTARSL